MIADKAPRLSSRDFERIRMLAYDYCGLVIENGKESLVASRLNKVLRAKGIASYRSYCDFVSANKSSSALVEMIDHLTTNHTSFFREPQHFTLLQTDVLPRLAKRAALRIWSAACSTGEEPYTIAFTTRERFGSAGPRLEILATDISTRVLGVARLGIYSAERLAGLPSEMQHRYMLKGAGPASGQFRVKREIREMIRFERLNLMEPFPPELGLFSIIFCRNAMIYFDAPTQERLVHRFSRHLEPGGYLLIGHAESLSGIRHALRFVRAATYQRAGSMEKDPRMAR